MPNPYFRFKQFTVYHDRCAMKVGTDGVLLGAWCDVAGCREIVDAGTGSGLIALMLAQRGGANITGVEIDGDAAAQAAENAILSPFAARVQIVHASFIDFADGAESKYDLVVSNPPYFIDALKPDDVARSLARHTGGMDYRQLVAGSCRLLSESGRLAVILPCDHFDFFARIAEEYALSLCRKTVVYPKPGAGAARVLMEWGRTPCPCVEEMLIIEVERHIYSDEFKRLTQEFYLDK